MTGLPPSAPVFPAGYGVLPADFNAWVQAPFAALTAKVIFRAVKTTAQTLPAAANAVIQYDTVLEDPYAGWNTTAFAWTPPSAWSGTYLVKVGVFSAAASLSRLTASACVNGSSIYALSSVRTDASVPDAACGECPVPLVGGQDAVTGLGYCTAGVALSVTAGQQSTMEITWLSN